MGTVLARAWRRESALHGETHWRCVAATGLELASEDATVDRAMVFCFGLLHDTRRVNDAVDPEHGARAAQFAEELRVDGLLQLGEARFSALIEALRLHSDGQVSPTRRSGPAGMPTACTSRGVSILPNPALLSTRAAHGQARLSAADTLRKDGPPAWDALVAISPALRAKATGHGRRVAGRRGVASAR